MPEDIFLRAIVTQAWQIAVLTIIVALLVRIFAARRPQVAHWLWLIVVVKCVTPPLWGHSLGLFSQIQSVITDSDVQPIEPVATAAEAEITAEFSPDLFADEVDVYPVDSEKVAFSFEPEFSAHEFETIAAQDRAGVLDVWAFATWLLIAGMIVSMLWLSWKFACCLRRIYAHRVTEFDDEIGPIVASLAKDLRLRRVPRVIVSDVRFGPAVLGIFRHLIVLPKCLIADEACRDPQTLRPILAHELLHIRRGDLWTGTLQAVVQCLWWFHPAVWIVNRLLSRETERSCDEQVVAELGCSPMEYARSLLAVIECKHRLKPVPVFPGMKPVEITSQRMERIMSLKQGSLTRMSLLSTLAVLVFAAVALPGGTANGQPDEVQTSTTAIEEAQENAKESTGTAGETGAKTDDSNSTNVKSESDATETSLSQTQVQKAGRVHVGGAVTTPMFLDLPTDREMTVIEAIAQAGGVSHLAGEDVVFSRRRPNEYTVLSLKSINGGSLKVRLQDGDVLCVKRAERSMGIPNLQQLVSVSFDDTPLPDAIRQIAVLTTTSMLVDTRSLGTVSDSHEILVSMEVNEVSLRTTLEMLCKNHGLAFELEHNLVKISDQKKPAEPSVPYNAKVVAERTFVRSGGGEAFYETSVLGRGSVVRVLREDSDGWLMIEPPEGSFSWVQKQNVRPNEYGKGEILNSGTVVFVGSSVKNEVNVWQVRMDAGETVAIFDEQRASTPLGVKQMYKILPPAREHRWIRSSALIPTEEQVRIVEPNPGAEVETQIRIEQEFADLRTQFNDLMRERRYAEAELVAHKAKDLNPNLPEAVLMVEKIKLLRQILLIEQIKEDKAENALKTLNSVNETTSAPIEDHTFPQSSKELPEQFNIEVYPVDDLVSLFRRFVETKNDVAIDGKDPENEKILNNQDFAALIELIQTTVEPGSWDINGGTGRLQANLNTRSIVIRQRPHIHDKIVELLTQLRRSKGQPIVTSCELLIFKTPQQIEWLEGNLKFRQHLDKHPWALAGC